MKPIAAHMLTESVPEPAKADATPTDQALASIKDVPGFVLLPFDFSRVITALRWLSTWGLGQHEAAFHKHGYDDLEVIEHLSAKVLEHVSSLVISAGSTLHGYFGQSYTGPTPRGRKILSYKGNF